ncbi:hypothetical protein BCR33DRAFT_666851 [Rhizoclosmatium globosum]|uniref:Protein-lysine N-methyltransferase EFM4 n=1 Tax=Rhizoclosmatium globosum TaxID=329046 RepID=A0A1Y2B1X4_9FUNG|nr:hypothetical protein BCR33DRAFT_666851 [Rhizoclosmatium globosum]|eukprot:ORY28734.1 hypothetical protein BCR33DRAFT_666851 [Rhizoclosmatium globosum]
MSSIEPTFSTSKLGTKKHWDECYEREITNFEEIGDIGEIWFGEDSVVKMMDWCEEHQPDLDVKTIDLGCGNGHILFEMSELGYTNLHGVDYSPASITLAEKIHQTSYPDASITWAPLDFMPFSATSPPPPEYNHTFQLAVDKGTFDAISLANGVVESDDGTPVNVCNWTEAELKEGFKEYFTFHSRKKYPTFTFGGVEGQTVVTVAFKRVQ